MNLRSLKATLVIFLASTGWCSFSKCLAADYGEGPCYEVSGNTDCAAEFANHLATPQLCSQAATTSTGSCTPNLHYSPGAIPSTGFDEVASGNSSKHLKERTEWWLCGSFVACAPQYVAGEWFCAADLNNVSENRYPKVDDESECYDEG